MPVTGHVYHREVLRIHTHKSKYRSERNSGKTELGLEWGVWWRGGGGEEQRGSSASAAPVPYLFQAGPTQGHHPSDRWCTATPSWPCPTAPQKRQGSSLGPCQGSLDSELPSVLQCPSFFPNFTARRLNWELGPTLPHECDTCVLSCVGSLHLPFYLCLLWATRTKHSHALNSSRYAFLL